MSQSLLWPQIQLRFQTKLSTAYEGAVKGAAEDNFGAVKGQKRAVILKKSSREGSEGPGNPDEIPLLTNHSDFTNYRRVGVPYCGPNLSFKGIISNTFL
jgi:hypothetical protein